MISDTGDVANGDARASLQGHARCMFCLFIYLNYIFIIILTVLNSNPFSGQATRSNRSSRGMLSCREDSFLKGECHSLHRSIIAHCLRYL